MAEQTKGQTAQLVAHRTGELHAAAMPQLAAQLADAVREMHADDVHIELDGKKNGDTSELRFRFRAYRRAKE
jgi:hypothetical protein